MEANQKGNKRKRGERALWATVLRSDHKLCDRTVFAYDVRTEERQSMWKNIGRSGALVFAYLHFCTWSDTILLSGRNTAIKGFRNTWQRRLSRDLWNKQLAKLRLWSDVALMHLTTKASESLISCRLTWEWISVWKDVVDVAYMHFVP